MIIMGRKEERRGRERKGLSCLSGGVTGLFHSWMVALVVQKALCSGMRRFADSQPGGARRPWGGEKEE
jgi:hypothetical protein